MADGGASAQAQRAVGLGVAAWAAVAALVKLDLPLAFPTRLPGGTRQVLLTSIAVASGVALTALVPAASPEKRLRGAAIATATALILDGLGFAFLPSLVYGVHYSTASLARGINRASYIFIGAGAGLLWVSLPTLGK